MATPVPPADLALDQRLQALERGFKLLVDTTKVERSVYLVTNVVFLITILGLLVYFLVFKEGPQDKAAQHYVELFIGGSGGGVAGLLTWRIMRIWDDYFRALREVLRIETPPPRRAAGRVPKREMP